ncbi:MAG: sulfite exporter TauE/SafE family protein [Candidatus Poribacteria bacterium]|nr:sulfite exporter TauE/SafE family protein [Candidatus Poribacteria bacterium]
MEYLWQIPLILVVGAFAGFLNVVAGGGSLLTLPFLIFLGLPAVMANGTNRIAIFIQNASGITGFRRKGVSDFRYGALLAAPAVVGALIGASIAIDMNEVLFKWVLAGIMVGVSINGFDLVRTNAIKILVVFFYTVITLVIFIKSENVNWFLGLTLAVGNASGAWFGSQWAVDKGEKWIKVVLVVTVLAFAVRLVWQSFG